MNISKENYLKTILDLGGDTGKVNNRDIVAALGISAPSVTEMLRKLLDDGFIDYKPYQGITLTEAGIEAAGQVKRRHHLWEVFLVEKLGYDLADIHDEAEHLEHVTSDKMADRLDEFLAYPETCPHGTPIIRR